MMATTADWAAWWPDGWRRPGVRRIVGPAAGYALAFGAVFGGGLHLADSADWSGLAHGRAALDAVAARAASAERVLAEAARRKPETAAFASSEAGRASDWATLALKLAERAASSGLRLRSLEPEAVQGVQPDRRRAVRIVADGDFSALRRAIGGLAAAPALVVPTAIRVERGAAALRMEISLDVFPALPADEAALASDGASASADGGDPFGGPDGSGAADAMPARLAGVMRDRRTGLALFDDGAGVITAVATGEVIGAARLVRIASDGVTVAVPDGVRRIGLDEGGTR
jgi:hypothetical protein